MKKAIKLLFYILVILLLFWGIIFLFWQWYYKAENEIFILPNDFEGAVIVLFNQKDGQPEEYDEMRNRLYTIPKNGVLKTSFKFQEGWRDIKYRYKNGTYLRYLLPSDRIWNDTIQNKRNDSIYVFNASYSNDYWFLVGKVNNIDYLTTEMSQKWKPFSKFTILKDGDSIGDVKHNKIFNHVKATD